MNIRQAEIKDAGTVWAITTNTIQAIYPRYYPLGAVNYFLAHHSEQNIADDISLQRVYVLEDGETALGTVTIKDFEMCRLFVLPLYQGHGYGKLLMEFSEKLIAKNFNRIQLDTSLPAKEIYLNQGYRELAFKHIITDNGDRLCYDVIEKHIPASCSSINYNGRVFVSKSNSENGEVTGETLFHYRQNGHILWADYSGGKVLRGHMIGKVSADGALDFHYQHINNSGHVRIGKCHSIPHVLEDGKLELYENWQWLNGDMSFGNSILVERHPTASHSG